MTGATHQGSELHRPAMHPLGARVFEIVVEGSQVVEAHDGEGGLLAQGLFADTKRLLQGALCPNEVALAVSRHPEVIEQGRVSLMAFVGQGAQNAEAPLEMACGGLEIASVEMPRPQVVEAGGDGGV